MNILKYDGDCQVVELKGLLKRLAAEFRLLPTVLRQLSRTSLASSQE